MFINYKHLTYGVRPSALVAILLSVLYTGASVANTEPELSISGFANIGITYAPNDELGFRTSLLNKGRDGLSLLPDSILGLQLNTKLNESLDVVGQIILQDRFDRHHSNYVEMAFLRYRLDRNWSVKVGRFNTKAYLFADYRYVGHAMNWLRSPIELYSQVGAVGNKNGIQASYTTDLSFGALKSSISYGQTRLHNDRPVGPFRLSYKNFGSINVELQADQWRFQAAYLSAHLEDVLFLGSDDIAGTEFLVPQALQGLARDVAGKLLPGGQRVSYMSAGAIYNVGNFEFIAELADYKSDWAFAGSSITSYASIAYSFDEVTPYVIIADVNRKEFPQIIDVESLEQQLPEPLLAIAIGLTQGVTDSIQSASFDQSSFSIGMRWDINFDWAVKMQFDHYRSAPFGTGLFANKEGIDAPSESSIYNVLAINFTTTF